MTFYCDPEKVDFFPQQQQQHHVQWHRQRQPLSEGSLWTLCPPVEVSHLIFTLCGVETIICWWGNQGLARFSNLPQVAQLKSSRDGSNPGLWDPRAHGLTTVFFLPFPSPGHSLYSQPNSSPPHTLKVNAFLMQWGLSPDIAHAYYIRMQQIPIP